MHNPNIMNIRQAWARAVPGRFFVLLLCAVVLVFGILTTVAVGADEKIARDPNSKRNPRPEQRILDGGLEQTRDPGPETGLPRRPVIVAGDVQYDHNGEPVYDNGLALQAVPKFYGLYYGDRSVAQYIVAGKQVRMAITSDSQFSGGPNRGLMGIVQTWPFTFSSLPVSTAASDPFFLQRVQPTDFLLSSSWHNMLTTTNTLDIPIRDVLSDSGIGDVSQIPMQFMWLSRPQGSNLFSGRIYRGDQQQTVMYDPQNWMSDKGVYLKMHLAFLQGGDTDLVDETDSWEFLMRFEHHEPEGDGLVSDEERITSPGPGVSQTTLNIDTNGGAKLTMMSSAVMQCAESVEGSWRPQWVAKREGGGGQASFFMLPGWVQRYKDEAQAEEGFGIPLVRSAAGRNPECFLHGGQVSNPILNNHGSNSKIRNWMWKNYGKPNVLMYSFGHNGTNRDISFPQAVSAFQADLFDLIYQDSHDLELLNGETPKVVLFLPWVGAKMNSQRHAEMLGVVKALNEIGIPALAISGYNRFGGDVFNEEFFLDGMNLHPGSENAAEIVWGEVYGLIDLASRVIYRGGQ